MESILFTWADPGQPLAISRLEGPLETGINAIILMLLVSLEWWPNKRH
jgi:hypothetical protein